MWSNSADFSYKVEFVMLLGVTFISYNGSFYMQTKHQLSKYRRVANTKVEFFINTVYQCFP